MKRLNVLVVDDEQGYRDEISEYLTDCGYEVKKAERPSQALDILHSYPIDIAVLDLRLPEINGIELLKKVLEIDPEIAVIMISGHGDMDSVIEAMREGAVDFFSKPFNLTDIQCSIQRMQKYLDLQKQLNSVRTAFDKLLINEDYVQKYHIVGTSENITDVLLLMEQVAKADDTDVLITGESGTGKELVARGIHLLSSRKQQIFFDVNCTAVPDNLFESEFFGHTKNAFTGAVSSKKGWFEVADKGTIFLDEIGDMPLQMQAKLLRVLEERKIRRVGSADDVHLDLRIIASTNQNLNQKVEQNLFRKDLYYRLNKFNIFIPPLRERPQDIITLLEYFNKKISLSLRKPLKPLGSNSIKLLQNYNFPGNVRELKNIVEKAVIKSQPRDKYLKIDHLHQHQKSAGSENLQGDITDLSLDKLMGLESEMIIEAMKKTANNKTRAAKLLNITRTSLNRRIIKHKLSFIS